MLRDIIEAIHIQDEVYTELIAGRLNQDEVGVLRNQRKGTDSFATNQFYWALEVYEQNPLLFNAIQMFYYLFRPIKNLQIEHYLDWKEKTEKLSR